MTEQSNPTTPAEESRAIYAVLADARAFVPNANGAAKAILMTAFDIIDRAERLADDLNHAACVTCETADGFDWNFVYVDSPADRAEYWNAQPVAYALTVLRLALAIGDGLAEALLDASDLEMVPA
jgi:hypothetical protein